MFKRVGATPPPPPRFYVKGSYVLDVVFGGSHARDIDVFYERTCERPNRDAVVQWTVDMGLPSAPTPDITPTDTLDDCSGGGFPQFNIDRWHIRQDGQLYTLVETTEESDLLPVGGRSAFKTKVVPLGLDEARKLKLEILVDLGALLGEEGIARIDKVLAKAAKYPQLENKTLRAQLEQRRGEIEVELTNVDDVDAGEDGEAPASG